jgi:hypothetical protein
MKSVCCSGIVAACYFAELLLHSRLVVGFQMSRMVWGHPDPQRDGYRQTTLKFSRDKEGAVKRPRADDSADMQAAARGQPDAERAPALDEAILYGPSGGGNRETQGRGRPRAFMNGAARQEVFEQSPYSRDFVAAWRSERGEAASGSDRKGDAGTTTMDDEIVKHFIGKDCPKDLFAGQVFFLNSCDADPLISMYHLEKIIRYLGGSTAMGPSKRVSYVVTQHLSYAKEEKVRAAMNRGATRGLAYRLVHPHFILDSARAGKLLPVAAYETHVAAERPQMIEAQPAGSDRPRPLGPANAAKTTSGAKPNVSTKADVITID